MKSACRPCKTKRPIKNGTSWLSALLIIVIPKCPFCVLAYSSAITMCGTSSLYLTENNWVSFLPVLLGGVIVTMIALNFRDNRTIWALGISSIGLLLIIGSHQLVIDSQYYHLGTFLLFFSILLNGSLFSLLKKLKNTNTLKLYRPGISHGFKIF